MNNLTSQTKRLSKNENAITLVALIITIIILIILAVVTINSLTHDGLADMAIKGAQYYDKAQQNEMNMLNEIDNMVKETLKNIEDGTTKPKPEEPSNPWGKDDLDEVKVKDEDGNDVSIPKPEGTEILNPNDKVDDGIIMKDQNDNEWVWVPVDETTYNSMFAESETPIALSGNTGVTTTRYSKGGIISGIDRVAPNTSSYREPDILASTTDGDALNYEQADFIGLQDMANKLIDDYNKMANSVKKYKGFYIGRYELSNEGVKKNKTSTVNTNWYNLYKECKNLIVDETKGFSRMIWGCQWDATCVWIRNSGIDIADSSNYGNYSGNKANTGATTYAVTNNIYDLAGNVIEWTQEAWSDNSHTYRGGEYSNLASYSVITGIGNGKAAYYAENVGTRPVYIINP